jgi:hypothetical protein
MSGSGIAAEDPQATAAESGVMGAAGEAGWRSKDPGIVGEFTRLAEILDAAGLGPADYLYAPLKWRLEHPDVSERSLRASAGKAWRLLAEPPPAPPATGQAAILLASSYSVSAEFLRKVREVFDPAEAVLCDVSDGAPGSALHRVLTRLGTLAALPSASIFAMRVNRALKRTGASPAERHRIAEAALTHAVYRRVARAILKQAKPECVVIANGNRPFEFALFAEAKARGLPTVLLPFAELNPKPARFLSLCRGGFDLALPFSEHSAEELRKLRKDAAIEVVGFPGGGAKADHEDAPERGERSVGEILYIGGNNFEAEACGMLSEALADAPELKLRVRPHPRNDQAEMRALFDFVAPERISDPDETSLAADLAAADIVVMVRSTVALDAMFAGKPLVWLSPPQHRRAFEDHPIRKQALALYDVSTAAELRTALRKLAGDPEERRHVATEQWSRLSAAGYRQGYYEAVRAALRRLVDWGPGPKTAARQAAAIQT